MANDIVRHEYNGFHIPQRNDGYVNLTAMAQAGGKLVADYLRLKGTKAYIAELSRKTDIPEFQLIDVNQGGDNKGTWAHSQIAMHFKRWCESARNNASSKNIFEKDVSAKLAKKLNGKREVRAKSGVIDILTRNEVIEVKDVGKWKSAVGQILVYGLDYPNHAKRIHLFGACLESLQEEIVDACTRLGVIATFEGSKHTKPKKTKHIIYWVNFKNKS